MANVFGIWLWGNGRDGFGELDGEPGVRVDADLDRFGVEIAGGEVPVLAFATVGRQLHRGAVGPVEGLIDVQHRLHVVIACGNVVERADGVTGSRPGNGDGVTGAKPVDGGAEDDLGPQCVINLHTRLSGSIV
jgi:hypothetical protein